MLRRKPEVGFDEVLAILLDEIIIKKTKNSTTAHLQLAIEDSYKKHRWTGNWKRNFGGKQKQKQMC